MAPNAGTISKIVTMNTLLDRCAAARAAGQRIVHCHGCFDLVHPGHVRHLEFAAGLGEVLLVSISGDGFIDKGTGRPLIPERLRAENLAALNCVDLVYIDPHETALETIEQVQPDIYIKGREYESNNDPRFLAERDAVERAGGRVVFSSGDIVFSSSALIAAMSDNHDPLDRALSQLDENHDLRPSTLDALLEQFTDRRVVVIGEPIIDSYLHCERPEVASESPVMTLRPITGETFDGGAAVICRHLRALGAQVDLVTALPRDDATADGLVERLEHENIGVHAVRSDEPVMEKQRYLVGHQKMMKVDLGRPMTLDQRERARLVDLAVEAATNGSHAATADAVIFADFGRSLLTPGTMTSLHTRLRPIVPVMTGDTSGRRANLRRLPGLDMVCPTEMELREAMSEFAEGLSALVWRYFQSTGVRSAIVTMGPEGVITFAEPGQHERPRETGAWRLNGPARLVSNHIPALGPIGIDPLGCGDALLSTATLALCAGADLVQAGYLGSLAAAIESRQLGNVPVGAASLRSEWKRLAQRHLLIASAV